MYLPVYLVGESPFEIVFLGERETCRSHDTSTTVTSHHSDIGQKSRRYFKRLSLIPHLGETFKILAYKK